MKFKFDRQVTRQNVTFSDNIGTINDDDAADNTSTRVRTRLIPYELKSIGKSDIHLVQAREPLDFLIRMFHSLFKSYLQT